MDNHIILIKFQPFRLFAIDATPRSVPSAPTSLLINYDETVPDSVDLSWVASDASNGSAIQSYNIYYSSLDPTFTSGVSIVNSTDARM